MSKIILIACFIISSVLTLSCGNENLPDPKIWENTATKGFLTISELRKKNPGVGNYETEGYVIDSNICECPGNANCTCPPSTITVSEQNDSQSKEQIIQIITHSDGFRRNQKYGFKIEISEENPASETLNNVFLLAYQKK